MVTIDLVTFGGITVRAVSDLSAMHFEFKFRNLWFLEGILYYLIVDYSKDRHVPGFSPKPLKSQSVHTNQRYLYDIMCQYKCELKCPSRIYQNSANVLDIPIICRSLSFSIIYHVY